MKTNLKKNPLSSHRGWRLWLAVAITAFLIKNVALSFLTLPQLGPRADHPSLKERMSEHSRR